MTLQERIESEHVSEPPEPTLEDLQYIVELIRALHNVLEEASPLAISAALSFTAMHLVHRGVVPRSMLSSDFNVAEHFFAKNREALARMELLMAGRSLPLPPELASLLN
jgi:hypothetical protein